MPRQRPARYPDLPGFGTHAPAGEPALYAPPTHESCLPASLGHLISRVAALVLCFLACVGDVTLVRVLTGPQSRRVVLPRRANVRLRYGPRGDAFEKQVLRSDRDAGLGLVTTGVCSISPSSGVRIVLPACACRAEDKERAPGCADSCSAPWPRTGGGELVLAQGTVAPNFELLDDKSQPFELYGTLARALDRKLLIAFFPAAAAEVAVNLANGRIPGEGQLGGRVRRGGVGMSGGGMHARGGGGPGERPQSVGLLSALAANYQAIR